ncbi:MAG: hypothetical protein ACK40A_14410 [Pannonibacter indicus]
MRTRWPFWMFSGIALVGLVVLVIILANGSVRLCGRMTGCTSYRFTESPGPFLLATFPAVMLLMAGSYGAWWWTRATGRR